MEKSEEIEYDIIDAELAEAYKEIDEISRPTSTEFSDISKMTENLDAQTTKLVAEQQLPEKEVIGEVSTTDMVIDLSLANIAKQTSVKLNRIESFLSKIEDILYDDKTLEGMNKNELITLYTNTRLMRTDAFKMLSEIRKTVDFGLLEAQLLSMHSKESMKEGEAGSGAKMQSILEEMLKSPDFLTAAQENQKQNLNKDK